MTYGCPNWVWDYNSTCLYCLILGRQFANSDNHDVTSKITSESDQREAELGDRCRCLADVLEQVSGSYPQQMLVSYSQIIRLVLKSRSTSAEVLRSRELQIFAVEVGLGVTYESNVVVGRNFGWLGI